MAFCLALPSQRRPSPFNAGMKRAQGTLPRRARPYIPVALHGRTRISTFTAVYHLRLRLRPGFSLFRHRFYWSHIPLLPTKVRGYYYLNYGCWSAAIELSPSHSRLCTSALAALPSRFLALWIPAYLIPESNPLSLTYND